MRIDLTDYTDDQKCKLVEARWTSSDELWQTIERTYKINTGAYENKAEWLQFVSERRRRFQVQANRIFVNMEAVINSLIANPPGINILPARDGIPAQDFARKLESFFRKKYTDLNMKEVLRMGLRNLYFGRLLVIKAFWDASLGNGGDFNYRALDPRKVRIAKYARNEKESEFVIEEIEDNLCAVIERFPDKKEALMQKYGFVGEGGEAELYIKNPDVKYKEAWVQDWVIFKLDTIELGTIKNPYWDWDGIMVTEEELAQLEPADGSVPMEPQARRQMLQSIKDQQEGRQPVEQVEGAEVEGDPAQQYQSYYYNYFDSPRKPYIFATIFNNENSPIGRTDMITLSLELQRSIDKRKMDIDENCELVNGILKVDASVMPKSDAQRIRFETKGIIWGKGVASGVSREMGTPLPAFVHEDMLDSRAEIDNIMAATSAFRGEREGQETKAGRLALIQQSFLRLNELVQVVDYVSKEAFDWGMQFAKTRYTEYHYAKWMGEEGAREVIELIQDDIENGNEVTIIAGKTLPVDDEFKFEQAQNDVAAGLLSPVDYLKVANYDNAKQLAQNAVKYKINPIVATGISPEEAQELAPPEQKDEKPPNVSISYSDLPPDAQVQLLAQIGIQADPRIIVAEKMAQHSQEKEKHQAEIETARTNNEVAVNPPKKEEKKPQKK